MEKNEAELKVIDFLPGQNGYWRLECVWAGEKAEDLGFLVWPIIAWAVIDGCEDGPFIGEVYLHPDGPCIAGFDDTDALVATRTVYAPDETKLEALRRDFCTRCMNEMDNDAGKAEH